MIWNMAILNQDNFFSVTGYSTMVPCNKHSQGPVFPDRTIGVWLKLLQQML